MATIEERAKGLYPYPEGWEWNKNKKWAIDPYGAQRESYKVGASEQKEIDDEELGKALLYCTNKTTERVRKEMIDKACKWLKAYCGMNESGLVQFRKAMEES